MAYWLMKSEPDVFGINDLAQRPLQTELWDGVRNYQARNYLKSMQVGDLAFFYHSNAKPPGIAGIVAISKTAYPDPTQFDMHSRYFDGRSNPADPRWVGVDVTLVAVFKHFISLDALRLEPALADLPLLRRGNRLSVLPMTPAAWEIINRMANMPVSYA